MFHRARIPAHDNAAIVRRRSPRLETIAGRPEWSVGGEKALSVVSNTTGLPFHAAAVTRTPVSGRLIVAPSQTATLSCATGGAHVVAADVNELKLRPAKANTPDQSGSRDVADSRSASGTAVNRTKRPDGSSTTSAIPGTSAGGSRNVTTPSMFSGTRTRGLCR